MLLFLTSSLLSLGTLPVNELAVSPFPLPPSFALPPSRPWSHRGTYAITTNEENKKIAASLLTPLPPGVFLLVEMEAPSHAISHGPLLLSGEPVVLVSNISRIAQKNLVIRYTLSYTTLLPSSTYPQTILFTLID